MRTRHTSILIILLFVTSAFAQQSPDEDMVNSVFRQLLAAPAAAHPGQKYTSWPPNVGIISTQRDGERAAEQMRLNAFAAAPDCHPIVRISQGLVSDVVKGDPDVLALILGHELGHLVLGHPLCTSSKDTTSVVEMAVTREQEYAADAKGYELALAAGYSVRRGLKGMQRLDEVSHYSSFEGLGADHPSWTDRLARLDKEQAPLWRTMSAFYDGVSFLATENYELAANCFRSVIREFPQAADVRGNLGYTLLMQYIDQLRNDDLRALGIGQIATGSFYAESLHLKSKVRGVDTALWTEAVQTLKAAEQADPTLALVKANLGLAYLVQPAGSDPKQALTYLVAAGTMLGGDKGLQNASGDTAARAVANNTAVAYLAAGNRSGADALLHSLWEHQRHNITDEQSLLQITALYFNVGTMLASSDDPAQRRVAADVLLKYLRVESADSMWWKLAYEKYAKVCPGASDSCVAEPQLKAGNHTFVREVAAVDLGGGKSLRLGESFRDAKTRIGQGQPVASVAGTGPLRTHYPQYALDVVASDVIIAIILNAKGAPELQLREVGTSSAKTSIRYGMTTDELEKVLADQPYRYEGLLDSWVPYRFYPGIGIAVRVGPQKTVDELVLVRSSMRAGGE
jgi:hypothetical protein